MAFVTRFEAIIEIVKIHVFSIFSSGVREGKANRQREEDPDSGVPAPSEQLPSESDSVCRLRQDDLAVIRSEEL